MPGNFRIEHESGAARSGAVLRKAESRSLRFPAVTFRTAKFRAIKEAVLGKTYRLTLIFASAVTVKKWNKIYRGRNKATDILSFPLSPREGEIYVCLSEAEKEAKKFGRPFANFIAFLFIHGLAHLKGYRHGATMEGIETKIRGKFGI